VGASSVFQNLIAHQTEAKGWKFLFAVEEIGGHGFLDVASQFFPIVRLREDTFRQALGHRAATAS